MLRRYVPVTRSSHLLLPGSWQHCCTDNARWQRAPTRRCNSIICSLKQNKFHLRTKTRHPTLPLTPPPHHTRSQMCFCHERWHIIGKLHLSKRRCTHSVQPTCQHNVLHQHSLPSCLFGFDSSHEMAARFPPLYVSGWSICIEVTSILWNSADNRRWTVHLPRLLWSY